MAKTNGLVGGVTGKIGNVIGYYRRGKYLARAYNPHTTNVRSKLQRFQRLRWTMLMAFLRQSLSALRVGFHYDAPGYELPRAMKANMPFINGTNEFDIEIDLDKVQLSAGQFENPVTLTGDMTSASGKITFNALISQDYRSYLPTEYDNGEAKYYVGVYNSDDKKWYINTPLDGGDFGNGTEITVPADFVGKMCNVFVFVAIEPERVLGIEGGIPEYCSTTKNLGSVTVA